MQATESPALDGFLGAFGWRRPQDSGWFWQELGRPFLEIADVAC